MRNFSRSKVHFPDLEVCCDMCTFFRSNQETLVGQELVTNPKERPRGRLFRGQCGVQNLPSRCQNLEVHIIGVRNFLSCRNAIFFNIFS